MMNSKFSQIALNGKYSVLILALISLLMSISITVISFNPENTGDEGRYVAYARNLVSGSFSPPGTRSLGNGPAYSFLIYPFIALWGDANLAVLLNPLMYTLSIFVFYKTALLFSNKKNSIRLSYLLLLYYPTLRYLPALLCEILTFFLVILFAYFITNGLIKFSLRSIVAAALTYSLLILTKPMFAYVLYGVVILFTLAYIFKVKSKCYFSIATFALSAILLSHIYFVYTYHITGKMFYWLNQSSPLWSMSVMGEGELGSYIPLSRRHIDFPHMIELTQEMDPVARDSVYKIVAINNIKSNPANYLNHWVYNVSRYLFNYPFSKAPQGFPLRSIPNSIILIYFIYSLFGSFKHGFKNKHSYTYMLLAVILIYSFGSTLVCANGRRIIPVIPLIYLLIQYYQENKTFQNTRINRIKQL